VQLGKTFFQSICSNFIFKLVPYIFFQWHFVCIPKVDWLPVYIIWLHDNRVFDPVHLLRCGWLHSQLSSRGRGLSSAPSYY